MQTRANEKYIETGFTLVELLITMFISSFIAALIYTVFVSQSRTYTAQDAVVEMQQNLRSGLGILVQDLRMAGFDPSNSNAAGFDNDVAFSNGDNDLQVYSTSTTLAFTADLDGDGTIDQAAEDIDNDGYTVMTEMEQIAYRLDNLELQRYSTVTPGTEWQPVARNIEQLEFRYLDGSANVTTDLGKVRTVQVSLLAKASQPDPKFSNTMIYTTASGNAWGPFNDNFRRRLLIKSVQCRNMGI